LGRVSGQTKVYSLLGLAILGVSTASILIRYSEAPAAALAFWRLVLALPVLAAGARAESRSARGPVPRDELRCVVASGICLAAHFHLWITSLRYTSVASSVVIVSSQPLFVMAGAHLWLGERSARRGLWGGVIAVLGGALVGMGDLQVSGQALLGDLLALGGAVALAAYFLLGRAARRRLGTFTYSGLVYGTAALVLAALAGFRGETLLGYPPREWMLFLGLAVLPTLGGHTLFNWALGKIRATVVSLAQLGEPVGAAGLAYLFFREIPSRWVLAGGALIMLGVYLHLTERQGGTPDVLDGAQAEDLAPTFTPEREGEGTAGCSGQGCS